MITELLAALSSLPRIAASLDSLAGTVAQLNDRAAKAKASQRRQRKDDEVDERIAALVDTRPSRMPDGGTGKQSPVDGAERLPRGCPCCTGVDARCVADDQ